MCVRTPIEVQRSAITVATDNGYKLGGWYAFPKPTENTPFIKTKGKQRVLWCPYCCAWTVFDSSSETGVETCTAMCGISVNDFYTRKYNNLF